MRSRTRRALRAAGRAITWPFRMIGRAITCCADAIADAIDALW